MSTLSVQFTTGINNEPMVSSREVAAKFGKEHKHVLRDLRERVLPFISEHFNRSNFGLVEYTDSKGETQTEYKMSKDGFLIVSMGFTGPEAMRWKEVFIGAFNQALGSIADLKNEIARKEALILQLQGKTKRERRWLAPSYDSQLPGFPVSPNMVLKPESEIKQPELNIARYNHLKRMLEGIERQMDLLKREIGMM